MENTTEDLKKLLNSNFGFNENKVLRLKTILLNSSLRELNINDLMKLDKKVYINSKLKRQKYIRIIKQIGFKIEKRKVSFLRKRKHKQTKFMDFKDFVFKTFWFIVIK